METTTTASRTFEVGDMFIFTGDPVSGDAYAKGDFLLIKWVGRYGVLFTTRDTVSGKTYVASGDTNYLCRELGAGVLEYQGNVKAGV